MLDGLEIEGLNCNSGLNPGEDAKRLSVEPPYCL